MSKITDSAFQPKQNLYGMKSQFSSKMTVLGNSTDSCSQCPHFDSFHSTCSHPYRQLLIKEFEANHEECPVYPSIRADAMNDLANNLI